MFSENFVNIWHMGIDNAKLWQVLTKVNKIYGSNTLLPTVWQNVVFVER